MGLEAKFRNAAATIFKAAGDVVRNAPGKPITLTYVSVVIGNYNSTTGVTSVTPTNYTPKTLLTGLDDREQAWFPADLNVQKAIIPFSDLSIDVSSEDHFIIDGVRWNIERVMTPPTKAIRKFYIREP